MYNYCLVYDQLFFKLYFRKQLQDYFRCLFGRQRKGNDHSTPNGWTAPEALFQGVLMHMQYIKIPSFVLFCRDLSPTAKLLYSVISAIDSDGDGCRIDNEILSEILEKSIRTISNSIKQLVDLGLVKVVNPNNDQRVLWIDENAWKKISRQVNIYNNNKNKFLLSLSNISLSKDKDYKHIARKKISRHSDQTRKTILLETNKRRDNPNLKNNLIEYWNEKSWCRTHLSTKSKTYKQTATLLRQLKAGTFGNKKEFEKKWEKQHADLIDKKWIDKEIKVAIDSTSLYLKEGYWPKDKERLPKSLNLLIYNPISRKSLLLSAYRSPPGLLSENKKLPMEIDESQTNELISILYGGDAVSPETISADDLSKVIIATNDIIEYEDWIFDEVFDQYPFLKRHFRDKSLIDYYITYLTEEIYTTIEIKPYMLGPSSPTKNWTGFIKFLAECLLPSSQKNYRIFEKH